MKTKITDYGIDYDFSKFIHPEVNREEIENFFKRYDEKIGLDRDFYINNVKEYEFLFLSRATDLMNRTSVKSAHVLSFKQEVLGFQYVKYSFTNKKGKQIIITFTDANSRFDPEKTYKEVKNVESNTSETVKITEENHLSKNPQTYLRYLKSFTLNTNVKSSETEVKDSFKVEENNEPVFIKDRDAIYWVNTQEVVMFISKLEETWVNIGSFTNLNISYVCGQSYYIVKYKFN